MPRLILVGGGAPRILVPRIQCDLEGPRVLVRYGGCVVNKWRVPQVGHLFTEQEGSPGGYELLRL